jgi:hypothetical protein
MAIPAPIGQVYDLPKASFRDKKLHYFTMGFNLAYHESTICTQASLFIGKSSPLFRNNVLPPSSGTKSKPRKMHAWHSACLAYSLILVNERIELPNKTQKCQMNLKSSLLFSQP